MSCVLSCTIFLVAFNIYFMFLPIKIRARTHIHIEFHSIMFYILPILLIFLIL